MKCPNCTLIRQPKPLKVQSINFGQGFRYIIIIMLQRFIIIQKNHLRNVTP